MLNATKSLKTKLANTAARFKTDEKGNFAIMAAVTMAVLVAGLAVSVDAANGQFAKQRLQDTTDAIALLAAKGLIETQADLDAAANEYLQSAYPGSEGLNIRLEDIKRDGDVVTVKASNKIQTYFTGVFGKSGMDIGASSQALFADTKLEVALVLDTTGSMKGSKMATLKVAGANLVDQLDRNNERGNIKMSVVPFAQYVNVGPNNVNANWLDVMPANGQSTADWNGCVGSRTGRLQKRVDVVGSSVVPATTGLSCGTPISSLSSDLNDTKLAISNLNPAGWTYLPSGLMWGWRTLDSRAPFQQAAAKSDAKTDKVMIVMTDGANTRSKNGSYHEAWSQANADKTAEDICSRIKDDNITVYTIAYSVGDTKTENLLRDCASDTDKYFDAENSAELEAAFNVIAASLTELRITA
jgi:Flp pilus assembly protein TadG